LDIRAETPRRGKKGVSAILFGCQQKLFGICAGIRVEQDFDDLLAAVAGHGLVPLLCYHLEPTSSSETRVAFLHSRHSDLYL